MKNIDIFSNICELPHVGDAVSSLLKKLCKGDKIIDLLFYIPQNYVDRRNKLSHNAIGKVVTFKAVVLQYGMLTQRSKRTPFKIIVDTDIGRISLVFFNYSLQYLKNLLSIGLECVISGKLENFLGEMQITHPDYITSNLTKFDEIYSIEPIYSLIRGLTSKGISKIVKSAIKLLPDFPEWLDNCLIQQNCWYSWKESIKKVHYPDDLEKIHLYRNRLAYDELLSYHISMYTIRKYHLKTGVSIVNNGNYRRRILEKLGFTLTTGQKNAIQEIIAAQALDSKMIKLLQGDVGSGKTVVALFAMLNALESEGQVAFMVPTEILATQHYNWIKQVTSELNISVALLTGATRQKKHVQNRLSQGEIQIIVGTHALFQDSIHFKNLRLVVIDEQQRFGVMQRMRLIEKGNTADVLFMTATPIPRTLEQIMYGDMECIKLLDKPKCRIPICTRIVSIAKLNEIILKLQLALQDGHKAYWICPCIEESETLDIAAAEKRFLFLKEIFADKVGLSHGNLSQRQREKSMYSFYNGEIQLLVATTVIEVGIDIPDATIIIIENAERFGLSQLHQLRGRVGRSNKPSFCILLHGTINDAAYKKLCVLRQLHDGFCIAEQDLLLRGGGDILGIKQSGLTDFKFVNALTDQCLITDVVAYVNTIMKQENLLKKNIHNLLKIFGYDSITFYY
ncbi:ATP-dependent DNA helicase RecG [Neoehrlichia mikurensis]|uniref:Probable DNA 3'-5' helicase RecG n=1 Tax=Neoehrlichia mikurensis TaxID=89586 RepID=A0A9Q9F4B0_9RICK|nr:ATP-dependent DNA helicase RecG [Neoehrlichia mikurensis]QXK92295.1 ATP-dependent DNA helicase RecG [Neoehrlichia mikurensis]QXK92749.1 ATP-dependent DNA helicase RecG [Neoehrlichia mikurensis]QXK93990.1 ATP-dependent DNA helicase RecG [Neoehrlichia mikurensis]UTO55847.1 ATP-dependent DNA helicase RecG [Neoehrlichia mikurensis]UTO56762.1 ATP-dependent DNA helicase RecG [Neoehrlichia mikurensis]